MSHIDTHAHLDPETYGEETPALIQRARAAGVIGLVAIGAGENLNAARHARALANEDLNIWAAIGVHPHYAKEASEETFAQLEEMAKDPRVVAIGEIGLDYHYDFSPRETQRRRFSEGLKLARSVGKPAIIHTRNADQETLDLLREQHVEQIGGIIHCFSSDWAFAKSALDLGLSLSFSGILTFNSAKAVQEVARKTPADRILVETDCPYLAPVPKRGKKNEPAWVVYTAAFLAKLRSASPEEIASLTTANACELLGLSLSL